MQNIKNYVQSTHNNYYYFHDLRCRLYTVSNRFSQNPSLPIVIHCDRSAHIWNSVVRYRPWEIFEQSETIFFFLHYSAHAPKITRFITVMSNGTVKRATATIVRTIKSEFRLSRSSRDVHRKGLCETSHRNRSITRKWHLSFRQLSHRMRGSEYNRITVTGQRHTDEYNVHNYQPSSSSDAVTCATISIKKKNHLICYVVGRLLI